ncbi:MAG: hypothetical protein IKW04_05410 [Clostridia bacterium]|nr:hypothetical protein [Clostridia bacterium]
MAEQTAKQQKILAKIATLQMQLDFYNNQLTADMDPKDQKQLEKKIAKLCSEIEQLRLRVTPTSLPTKSDHLSSQLKKYRILLTLALVIIILLAVVFFVITQKYSQLQISYRSANYWSDYYREEAEELNKKIQKLTGDTTPTSSPEPTQSPDRPNDEKDTQETDSNENSFYYVRKSANDKASQLGAFQVLENAKNLADTHKAEGYKVYDSQGKCIYTP